MFNSSMKAASSAWQFVQISDSQKASQNIQQILTSANLLAVNRQNQPLQCVSMTPCLPWIHHLCHALVNAIPGQRQIMQ